MRGHLNGLEAEQGREKQILSGQMREHKTPCKWTWHNSPIEIEDTNEAEKIKISKQETIHVVFKTHKPASSKMTTQQQNYQH